MSEGLQAIMNDDGVFEEYDDTYDLTIHCESREEQEEVLNKLNYRWIPVSERLPEEGTYLICTDKGYIATIMYDRSMGWLLNANIIAWMPLPTPYEPQESDNRRCDNCKYFGEILKDNIHSCNNNKSIFKACLETATGCEKFEPQESEE